MTTTLEKAARAIWDDRESRKRSQKPWEDAHPEDAEDCRLNARAALQAIREPDRYVNLVGLAVFGKAGDKAATSNMINVFTAMIDAILAEDKG